MRDASTLLYPDWQSQYQAAMLELDPSKLPERILCAHQAISQRLRALSQDHFGTPEERNAIADALNGLAILERETEGTKKRQA
jgi:hypothetical protein